MHRSLPYSAFLLGFALLGCKPTAHGQAAEIEGGAKTLDANAPAAAARAQPACADADFTSFLKRFEESAAVQRASSANPLTMESMDQEAQPEPTIVTRNVPLTEVRFPVMLGSAERAKQGLERVVSEPSTSEHQVTVRVPDSGVQTRYGFRATPCWRLVRVSDDTI